MDAAESRSRWRPVLAYAALSAANQMLWLTFTPLTNGAARHYGVSSGAVGWLAELFPLLYVVLALPAGRLVDRNLPLWLGIGAALTAAGAVLRLASVDYLPVLAGQVLVAVAQPLVLNAVIPVSARFLTGRDQTTGLAVSSAGIFAGMLLALVLGAVLGAGHIGALLLVQAVLTVLAAAALWATVRAPAPAAAAATPRAAPAPLRAVWSDRQIRLLVGLVCVGFGVFIALTTWLQALLDPAGVSESAAGVLLLIMVVAGVAGSAVLPPLIARRGREAAFVLLSIGVGMLGMLALAVAPGVVTGAVVLVAVGAVLLTDLPVILELVERRSSGAGGTASALVWLAGNGAGLVAALIVQALLDTPAAAFAVLAVLLAAGVPLATRLRVERSVSRRPAS